MSDATARLSDLPSAKDLGISVAHRRTLLRESHFRFLRSMAAEYRSDPYSTNAPAMVARYQGECADYLRRRARGESMREIVQSRH